MIDERQIAVRRELVSGTLSEPQRAVAGGGAGALAGAGGVSITAHATSLSRRTIQRGLRDLEVGSVPEAYSLRTLFLMPRTVMRAP
jgi:formiminotetrahydrofolate cyclodeaminase